MKLMTMKQFLQNPSGPQSASFARRDIIIQNLEERFAKLYAKRKKDFKVIIFRGSNKNDFVFYFKIPSEKEEYSDLVYDVVIKFMPVSIKAMSALTIDNYAVNVFSNSPNFFYTYAYWYNQDDIIVSELKSKLSKLSLEEKPEVKNPEGIYGFEKSVYFAFLYMKYNNLNYKQTINSFLQPNLSLTKIKPQIKSCTAKMIEYNNAKQKAKDAKKEERKKKIALNNANASRRKHKF